MTHVFEMSDPLTGGIIDPQQIAEQFLAQVKEKGVSLVGPGGLLESPTKAMLTATGPVEIEVPRDRDGAF